MNKIKRGFIIIAAVLVFTTSITVIAAPENTNSVTSKPYIEFQTRQPMRKRDLAMKFVLAMLGVVASSVTIYVLLSLYNRIMYGGNPARNIERLEDNDYKTSTNMKEALNIFLKKTK